MSALTSVFIANRGQIALRIICACRESGIREILGDLSIGPARSQESYLRAETIVCAALATGADAVHPGYGFLAEQPELPRLCKEHGLEFIGPPEGDPGEDVFL